MIPPVGLMTGKNIFFEVSDQTKVLFLESAVVDLVVSSFGGGGGGVWGSQRLLTLGSHWSVGLSGRRGKTVKRQKT